MTAIKDEHLDLITSNLLFNYGFFDEHEVYIKEFYKHNKIVLPFDINNYHLLLFGKKRKEINIITSNDINKSMDYSKICFDNIKAIANKNNANAYVFFDKVSNSKQICVMFSLNDSTKSPIDLSMQFISEYRRIFRKNEEEFSSLALNYSGYSGLHNAYLDARNLYELRFFEPDTNMITKKYVETNQDNLDYVGIMNMCANINDLLFDLNSKHLNCAIDDLFDKLKRSFDINYVKTAVSVLDSIFYSFFNANGMKIPYELKNFNFENYVTISDIKNYAKNILTLICNGNKTGYSRITIGSLNYIQNNYKNKNLCLGDIAAYVNISSQYLSATFKKEMNMCISDYINNVRINHASKLLLTTNSSIDEIAEKVGYNSSCYFYRTFKKYKNLSPAKYKKRFY